MTTPPPPYPGQDPNVAQPYPGQDPYAQQPYPGQQPYDGQPQYPAPDPYTQQQPYPGQPAYPAPDPYAQQQYPAPDPSTQQQPYQGQDPYAQQPYGGQQYQQPAFAAPQMPGPAPAEPKKKSQRWVGILIAVLVAAGFGTYRFIQSQSNPEKASVGDCISYESETDVSIVKCDSDKAQYRVEARVESSLAIACDSVADSDVQLYSKDEGSSKQFSLCVSLVLHEGDCVSNGGEEVACDDPDVMGKVTSIHEGTSDPSVCSAEEIGRPYTLRPRVVCVTQSS